MIAFERLAMLSLGELDDAEAEEVEEHVLACGPCARVLERLLEIGHATLGLLRAGKFAFPASRALALRLTAAGLVSRTYRLASGAIVPCGTAAEDIYVLTTLEADLRGASRIDLVRTTPAGSTRSEDVPFDVERGEVSYVSRSDVVRRLPSARIKLELWVVDASGERKLSECFLEHTGFEPG